jgi:hypothetical protein
LSLQRCNILLYLCGSCRRSRSTARRKYVVVESETRVSTQIKQIAIIELHLHHRVSCGEESLMGIHFVTDLRDTGRSINADDFHLANDDFDRAYGLASGGRGCHDVLRLGYRYIWPAERRLIRPKYLLMAVQTLGL